MEKALTELFSSATYAGQSYLDMLYKAWAETKATSVCTQTINWWLMNGDFALICMISILLLLIFTKFIWREYSLSLRGKTMGKWERQQLQDKFLSERIVTAITDGCNSGLFNDQEAMEQYRRFARVAGFPDLRTRKMVKKQIQERLENGEHSQKVNLPGDTPSTDNPVRRGKRKLLTA